MQRYNAGIKEVTMLTCPMPHRYSDQCKNARCGRFTFGYVYGLLDTRISDIFYVGSTVRSPGERYSEHMKGKSVGNFREAWIMAILNSGSIPVLLSFGEFNTTCEQELQSIENQIALALRSIGHTALSDDSAGNDHNVLRRLPKSLYARFNFRGNERNDARPEYPANLYWHSIENIVIEYIDRVNEQARVTNWLRDVARG